jgi:hypothetical protein
MSELREQYDALTAASDTEYKLAGEAMRTGDFDRYKHHVDRSWALVDESKPLLKQLSESEQREIKSQALTAMATAFVRGLGRA